MHNFVRIKKKPGMEPETQQYFLINRSATIPELLAIDANIRAIKNTPAGISLSSLVAYLSTVNGTAFAMPTVVDLSPYVMTPGWKFSWVDSGNKTAYAYGKAAGTGETLGEVELFGNTTFTEDEWWLKGTGWTISDGKANFTTPAAIMSKSNVYTAATLYRVTWELVSLNSGYARCYTGNSYTPIRAVTGTYSETFTATGNTCGFGAAVTSTGSIDNVSAKQVLTPSALGLTLTSTPGGTTFNWASVEAGFNPNSATWTLNITRD